MTDEMGAALDLLQRMTAKPHMSPSQFDQLREEACAFIARYHEDADVALVRRSFDCAKGSAVDQALDRIATRLKATNAANLNQTPVADSVTVKFAQED